MGRHIEGQDRAQSVLFPGRLDDWIHEDSTVRVIDVFVDELDLRKLGFERADPAVTGRPAYSPSTLLKIYVYGYLNRVQSSRRLETEAQRNLELIWLTGRLAPDFKTIADFRRDNGEAIRKVCKEFVLLCRRMKLFTDGIVAIDGSKFKAVNNRDKIFTDRKLQARIEQLDDSIKRYLVELDRADRDATAVLPGRVAHLKADIVAGQHAVERAVVRLCQSGAVAQTAVGPRAASPLPPVRPWRCCCSSSRACSVAAVLIRCSTIWAVMSSKCSPTSWAR